MGTRFVVSTLTSWQKACFGPEGESGWHSWDRESVLEIGWELSLEDKDTLKKKNGAVCLKLCGKTFQFAAKEKSLNRIELFMLKKPENHTQNLLTIVLT